MNNLNVTMPASELTVIMAVQMDGFKRGATAAKSLKAQKTLLELAKQSLKSGMLSTAQQYLSAWKKERACFKILLGL